MGVCLARRGDDKRCSEIVNGNVVTDGSRQGSTCGCKSGN